MQNQNEITNYFSYLPMETLFQIYDFLDFDEFMKLRLVSRFFKRNSYLNLIDRLKEQRIDKIATGVQHALFLQKNGRVLACGDNVFGEWDTHSVEILGRISFDSGEHSDKDLEIKSINFPELLTGLTKVRDMVVATNHSFFIGKNGTVLTLGANSKGQLGVGEEKHLLSPTLIAGLEKIINIVSGSSFTYFLNEFGQIRGCGDNKKLGLGNQKTFKTPTLIPELVEIVKIILSIHVAFFLNAVDQVLVCGSNHFGQMGIDQEKVNVPTLIPNLPKVAEIFIANGSSTFFRMCDGSVWGCGDNRLGVLGLGDLEKVKIPTEIPQLKGIQEIASIDSHAFFRSDEGKVWLCGNNHKNILGIGNIDLYKRPILITDLTDVEELYANKDSFFRTKQGKVWACGTATINRLGLTDPKNSGKPVQIPELNNIEKMINFEDKFVCIDKEGTLWGYEVENDSIIYKQLPSTLSQIKSSVSKKIFGDYDFSIAPIESEQPYKFTQIMNSISSFFSKPISHAHSQQVNNANNNASSDLTHADLNPNRKKFKPVIDKVDKVFRGYKYQFFIKKDGTVWGRGDNSHQQLGLGSEIKETTKPLPIKALNTWVGKVKILEDKYLNESIYNEENTLNNRGGVKFV